MKRLSTLSTMLMAAGAGALAVAGAWTTARGEVGPPPDPASVQARSLDTTPPVFRPPVDDGPAMRPNHPPIETIPPIPVPESRIGAGPPATDTLLSHDALTGRTIELAGPVPTGDDGGSGGGYNGADGGAGWEIEDPLASFWDMTQVTNPGDFPWRMNCKIVMRFTDQSGATRFFTGSGAMLDAETVVTAGHCVYARGASGSDIYDWAEEIWVYPGWDGVGGSFNPPPSTVYHFGFGHGTSFMAGTDYINNGNTDRDCGLIEITRGVGMLTGWFGWSWGYDCSTIQSRTYNNASFPSQNCPIDGLHNGADMYYWYGIIDSCPGNQMELSTGGGNCFDTVWGGMSGSAMYWIENDYRRAHAICSTSDRDTWGRYCKLWEGFVTAMNDSFIPGARGGTFDLQALDVNAEPAVIEHGSQLTLADFYATNPTNASASGTWTYRLYLSTNDNISEADTLLSTQSFTYAFGTMSGVRVNMSLPTIPLDTPPGDYWIGVILDPATDAVSSNNDTDGWDAVPITVVDHCFTAPVYDWNVVPASSWQTVAATSVGAGGCRTYRMFLYTGYDYDFSLCLDDGVGGWAAPGDADLRLFDAAGNTIWYIDGTTWCGYDASTLGTTYERWSPPAHGYYYLEVSDYYGGGIDYQLAYRYASTEHCYAPPSYDIELTPSNAWQTTPLQSIDAPDGCRTYRMYLSSSAAYDFSVCSDDGVGGWADPGDGDFFMYDAAGYLLWDIDGNWSCDYDASTIGSIFEQWSPPSDGYYYLEVDDYYDTFVTYQLAYRSYAVAPPNDNCWDVNPLTLNPGSPVVFTGNNVGATIDSDLTYPEVWHAFTTTQCVDLSLAYCGTTPVHGTVYIVMKEECPAVGPNLYDTSYDFTSCGDDNATVYWDDLPPGTYWYPVVLQPGISEGPYTITATAVSCAATCIGDTDGDADVDFNDLLDLLASWGPCINCPADFNGNNEVEFQDLLALLNAWGPC